MSRAAARPDTRWYQVMTSLLYPAVLGTIVYAFGDEAWKQGLGLLGSAERPVLLLWLALVLLFTLDYAYTLNDNSGCDYGGFQFLLDTGALLLLFIAGKALLEPQAVAWTLLPWLLLGVKLLALIYEISRPRTGAGQGGSAGLWKRYESDAVPLMVYLLVSFLVLFWPPAWPLALAGAMLFDAASYLRRLN